ELEPRRLVDYLVAAAGGSQTLDRFSGTEGAHSATLPLPALRAMAAVLFGDTHPGVDGEATVGQRQHRVQVQLRDLGKVVHQQRETQEEVDERRLVRRRSSSEPGHEPP